MGKRICLTVTNDLTYDQRMHRICTSLAENGYDITLVGRKLRNSLPLTEKNYRQKRIRCWYSKGKLFYFEYNLRLLFWLLFHKMDAVCAIDLDTILPCYLVSKLKRKKRIYDAHELFTGLKEVVTRPGIKKAWEKVERKMVPRFRHGYTVSESIAEEFYNRYGVQYTTIRNVPVFNELPVIENKEKFILYQGAVNEGRGFEWLIPAMRQVNCKLVICGDGNFMSKLKKLIEENQLEDKIVLKGMIPPAQLLEISVQARAGVAIAENTGLNQWLALPNKFFDYIHAGLPQITMNFPEYRKMNKEFEVAVLLNGTKPEEISIAINNLLNDDVLYQKLRENCMAARKVFCWQNEEKKLLSFYQSVFES